MAKRELPDQALLLKLLRYEPETGRLYWRERDIGMFNRPGRGGPASAMGRWNKLYANKEAFTSVHVQGYRFGSIFDIPLRAHRVVFALCHGIWPPAIDHINGDPADNRIENLRAATYQDNARNRAKQLGRSSPVIGVSWVKKVGRWRGMIRHKGKQHCLGYFDSLSEAADARKRAEKLFGYHPNHGTRFPQTSMKKVP